MFLCPVCGEPFDEAAEHDASECKEARLLLLAEQEFLYNVLNQQEEVQENE